MPKKDSSVDPLTSAQNTSPDEVHSDAPFDVIAVLIHKYFRIGKDRNNKYKNKRFTKVEFRTHTDRDILELAKLFGGGGHKLASGATIMDGLDVEELIKSIGSYYNTPAPNSETKENEE